MPAYARSAIKNICNRIHLRRLSYRILGFIQYLKAKPIRGYILLDGTRRVEFNYIYFISAQIQLRGWRILVCAEGGQQRRQPGGLHCQPCLEAAGAWNPAPGVVPALPQPGASVLQLPGGPDLHGTPDGSSRGRRELSVPEQSGSPLY